MPDTVNFLYLGLAVTFILAGGYAASIWIRTRSLRKDQDVIEQIYRDNA